MLPCLVINLERRPDRWKTFESLAEKATFKNYIRVNAIDGAFVNDSDQLGLFRNFPRHPLQGEIGCALSHLNIWKSITTTTLVLEDDVRFTDEFNEKINRLLKHIETINYDIVYIGYHPNVNVCKAKTIDLKEIQKDKYNEVVFSLHDICLTTGMDNDIFGIHGGGTFGYIITPQGAKKFCESVENVGFLWPLDYHMLLFYKRVSSYCAVEPLVFSDMCSMETMEEIDTDIQHSEPVQIMVVNK